MCLLRDFSCKIVVALPPQWPVWRSPTHPRGQKAPGSKVTSGAQWCCMLHRKRLQAFPTFGIGFFYFSRGCLWVFSLGCFFFFLVATTLGERRKRATLRRWFLQPIAQRRLSSTKLWDTNNRSGCTTIQKTTADATDTKTQSVRFLLLNCARRWPVAHMWGAGVKLN